MVVDPKAMAKWSQPPDISQLQRMQEETLCQMGCNRSQEGLVEEPPAIESAGGDSTQGENQKLLHCTMTHC